MKGVFCALKVVVISGHAQNGKDTVAGLLKLCIEHDGHSVIIAHYADLLKYICKTFFGWNGQKDEVGRSLLQYVGTDVIRKKAPDYWVDFIISVMKLFDDKWEYVIIPDTRFPNEINRLIDSGFDVTHIRVDRPNFVSSLTIEQQKHPSETALDDTMPDFTIINDGTLSELSDFVENNVKEFVYGA